MTFKINWLRIILISILLGGCANTEQAATLAEEDKNEDVVVDSPTPKFRPIRVVSPFPAITNAPFVSAEEIDEQVVGKELVLGVVINGEARAYPINMLTGPSREIINDTLGGSAIAATW